MRIKRSSTSSTRNWLTKTQELRRILAVNYILKILFIIIKEIKKNPAVDL
jgi:hypothetical protein